MMGIDVGAAEVTRSDGSSFPHRGVETPRDLISRVADEIPHVVVRGDRCELLPAQEIYATAVANAVRARPHDATRPIALAVPGWWTPRALARVRAALSARGLDVLLVNDAEAAVLEHRESGHPVPDTVAVVSLRAEQTSVVVVRHCREHPQALRSPALVHDEGGHHLDVAVLRHLVGGLTDLGEQVDRDDPRTIEAARESLTVCRELREALSVSAVESVRPELPGIDRRLRLVRSELEEIATPWADAVTGMVRTAVSRCAHPVDAVLLVGGLAAMPLIGQRLSADLGVEVILADEPALAVARGASRLLLEDTGQASFPQASYAGATRPTPFAWAAPWRAKGRSRGVAGKRRRADAGAAGSSIRLASDRPAPPAADRMPLHPPSQPEAPAGAGQEVREREGARR